MTRPWRWLPALMLALGACQPLPHPFAEDRPSPSLLTLRDSAGVTIGPIGGQPESTASRLRDAVAKKLQEHDIPASASTASTTSYHLAGRIEQSPSPSQGKSRVTVYWRLRDAKGKTVGERKAMFEASPADWRGGAEKPVGELAAMSAEMLAPMLSDEPTGHPVAELAASAKVRVTIGGVEGAPGDGDKSLANAVATVLRQQDLDVITDPKSQADLRLDGQVSLSAGGSGKQHVKIVWRLRRGDGSEIGTVGQENDVPKGTLDGAWGDVAYSVAVAAQSGILELVSRGGRAPAAVPKS